MTFRQIHQPCQKLKERDEKIKNRKCKCHHHQQVNCVQKVNKSFEQIQQFCDRLYNQGERLKKKRVKQIQRVSKLKQQKEMEECTFVPRVYQNPEYFVSKSSFLERELNWSESKIKKLKQEKEKKSSLEIVGCDFKPKIIRNSEKIIEKMKTEKKVIETPAKRRVDVMTGNSYMNTYKKYQTGKKLFQGSDVGKRKIGLSGISHEKKVCQQTNQSTNQIEPKEQETISKGDDKQENIEKQEDNQDCL